MSSSPITAEQLAALPPEIRAVVQSLIEHYEGRISALEAELAAARKTPQNSSLPPSTQHPHAKPPSAKPPSKRQRGGQPGHLKHERALIPTAECHEVFEHRPRHCRGCGAKLVGSDADPLRHQVWELPEIQPLVDEHRLHRLTCECGLTTCGVLPVGVPQGQAGPRLIAFTALLMGCFRQSKRQTAVFLSSLLNVPCSPGWVVKLQNHATAALRPCYDELVQQLPQQPQLNIDETPGKQGSLKTWMWGFVAATFTVFALRLTRKAVELYAFIGEDFPGVVGCDRAKMYLRMERIQWCWAHLLRDFQALIDSHDGQAKRLGHDLQRQTRTMFERWHKVRDGTLSRRAFQQQMQPIRREVEALLLRGLFSGNRLFAGMCAELHQGRNNLWTFVDVEHVEPTNNSSERALRHPVIWRKLSFGTQSDAGSRFVETILTVLETCRQTQRNSFAFVTHSIAAHFSGHTPQTLITGV